MPMNKNKPTGPKPPPPPAPPRSRLPSIRYEQFDVTPVTMTPPPVSDNFIPGLIAGGIIGWMFGGYVQ